MKDSFKTMSETELCDKVFYSVLGFLLAIFVFAVSMGALYAAGWGCIMAYQKWASTSEFISVGDAGYYYDHAHACFVKPYPNRKILKGCHGLQYQESDSIGIIRTSDYDYRYVNLNTMAYLNDMVYSRAFLFQNGHAFAISQDSLYDLRPDGSVISAELANWIYASVDEIICYSRENDNGDLIYIEKKTDVLKYEDSNHRYGLMSSDFVRLTEPIFSDITALSTSVFLCEYHDSGLGVIIDNHGNIIK